MLAHLRAGIENCCACLQQSNTKQNRSDPQEKAKDESGGDEGEVRGVYKQHQTKGEKRAN